MEIQKKVIKIDINPVIPTSGEERLAKKLVLTRY